jgi:uncharacterized protein (DUF111 family)
MATFSSHIIDASSKNPKLSKRFKAHVDCSNGLLCEKVLLAACLDAYIDGKDANYANDVLEGFQTTIFGIANSNRSMMVTAVKKQSSEGLYVIYNQSLTTAKQTQPAQVAAHVERRKHNIIMDVLKSLTFDCTIVKWEALPDWVTETTRRVINEILNANERVQSNEKYKIKTSNNQDDEESDDDFRRENGEIAYLYIFYTIATLLCLDSMGVREVSCSPLPMCTTVQSQTAAIMKELLLGIEIIPLSKSKTVLLSTVFGTALIRVLRCRVTSFILLQSGWGAVEENDDNTISIVIGCETDNVGIPNYNNTMNNYLYHFDHVTHLETNLDDITGENLAFAIQILLDNGALDAWVTPIVMKKGRPAHTLHCLCRDNILNEDDDDDTINTLLELIFIHTLTLGIRIYRNVPRAKLDRSITTVDTPYINTSRKGKVDVKVSKFKNGKIVRKKAEFDHCKVISTEVGNIGISTVAEQAVMAYDKVNTT